VQPDIYKKLSIRQALCMPPELPTVRPGGDRLAEKSQDGVLEKAVFTKHVAKLISVEVEQLPLKTVEVPAKVRAPLALLFVVLGMMSSPLLGCGHYWLRPHSSGLRHLSLLQRHEPPHQPQHSIF